MKPFILSAFLSLLLGLFSSCGNNDDNATAESFAQPEKIHSQIVYSRGMEAGRKAMEFEPDSRERESEMLKAHAVISALEEKGFNKSASDFKAGLTSILSQQN